MNPQIPFVEGRARPSSKRPITSTPAPHPSIPLNDISDVHCDKDVFEVKFFNRHFLPDEIKFKIVNNCLILEGKHGEKKDLNGFISRSFKRRYLLPEDARTLEITSCRTLDGILKIRIPRGGLLTSTPFYQCLDFLNDQDLLAKACNEKYQKK